MGTTFGLKIELTTWRWASLLARVTSVRHMFWTTNTLKNTTLNSEMNKLNKCKDGRNDGC
jgi:hypothetical protein